MATPGYLLICCLNNRNTSEPRNISPPLEYIQLQIKVINVISLIFAILASLCVLISTFLWRRRDTRSTRRRNPLTNGSVVKCLIAAGLLGNLGLIVRSCFWLAAGLYPLFEEANYRDYRHIFCICSALWVEYFFLCSVFWHIVYGLEAYLVSQKKTWSKIVKHTLGWVFPAIFCAVGALVVYQPSLPSCSAKDAVDKRILLYLLLLVPILVAVLFLSLLLYKATKAVKRSLIQQSGRFSNTERDILDTLQIKFILFIAAFSVSWLPNLVDGVWINIGQLEDKSQELLLVLLVLMSVLNPVLVLLDAMVLWGYPARCLKRPGTNQDLHDSLSDGHLQGPPQRSFTRSYSSCETDPLLSFRRN